jgi:hypothetical protein
MTTSIREVVAWIARRDPQFPSQLRAASEDEIAFLESVAGRPLPTEYREFLALMGHGTGWLTLADADLDIETVTAYSRALGKAVPSDHFFIGRALSDPFYDIYLHVPAPGLTRVVSFPKAPSTNFAAFAAVHRLTLAGSLSEWIGTAALVALRFPELPARMMISSPAINSGRLMNGEHMLSELGLQPLFFSNDWVRAYDGDGVAGIGFEFPRCRCHFDLRAVQAVALRPLAAAAERALDTAAKNPMD